MRKIKQILTETGWVYQKDGDITTFQVNGEMASIIWYEQKATGREFNGKYVLEVDYFPSPVQEGNKK